MIVGVLGFLPLTSFLAIIKVLPYNIIISLKWRFRMQIENQKTIKKTYSLPKPLVQKFESITQKRKRSSVVSALIEKWIKEKEIESLREQIVIGCKEMADVYLGIEREYHPLEEEVERVCNGN